MKTCKKCGTDFDRSPSCRRQMCFECSPIKRKMTDFSKQILEMRSVGMSQSGIARELGCSKASVSYWCKGDKLTQCRPVPEVHRCLCGKKMRKENSICKVCSFIEDPAIQDILYSEGAHSNAYGKIRSRARRHAKLHKLGENGCQNCGYSQHVEICHIKPVSSFPLDTKLSIVNDITNLLALCPNCHWEFDHKGLKTK